MIITPSHEQKDIKWLAQEYPDLYGWLDDMTSYLCIEALADIGLAGAFEQKLTVSPSRTHLKP